MTGFKLTNWICADVSPAFHGWCLFMQMQARCSDVCVYDLMHWIAQIQLKDYENWAKLLGSIGIKTYQHQCSDVTTESNCPSAHCSWQRNNCENYFNWQEVFSLLLPNWCKRFEVKYLIIMIKVSRTWVGWVCEWKIATAAASIQPIINYCVCFSLRWRQNGRDSVSNHQPYDCLLNRLFRRRWKKISKLRITGLCAGNSPGTCEFPAQMASNAENVSIWWRHHVGILYVSVNGVINGFYSAPIHYISYR